MASRGFAELIRRKKVFFTLITGFILMLFGLNLSGQKLDGVIRYLV